MSLKSRRYIAENSKTRFNGILLMDKHLGVTSNRLLQDARKLFANARGGHTGTLDPLATGLLPLVFGEATKFSSFLINENKIYRVVARMGWESDSGDSEGKLTPLCLSALPSEKQIRKVVDSFRGEVSQVPPMHSALKKNGRRLYSLIREGVEAYREKRNVRILKLIILNIDQEFIELEIECSKGTYIRTLIQDIGLELGCGAYVTKLRRIAVGDFLLSSAISLKILHGLSLEERKQFLKPTDSLLRSLPKVIFDKKDITSIRLGQFVAMQDHDFAPGLARVYGPDNLFVGIGEIDVDGQFKPKRLISNTACLAQKI